MIRRILSLLTLFVVLVGSVSVPPALAGGPPTESPIPPLRADGPVVLPNGRVLPVKPDWVQESSIQAEMLSEHANDRLTFEPGAPPRARGEAGATLGLASTDAPPITPLTLAAPSVVEPSTATAAALPNGMRKEVFGFLPYWMLNASSLQWMQYQLVSTIGYFGVAAASNGTLTTTGAGWSGWNSSAMTNVINAAHAKGVRVVLTVTMMAWDGGTAQAALLGNATARASLVNAIVSTVRNRAADGVNLDFEPVSTTLRDQYTSFVRQLKTGLVAAGVGSYLTVDTMAGAATWATGYDVAGLTASGAADAVFVMGYDYSWSGSARAGGVAPMDSPYILDVRESVDDYLSVIAGSKIIWGVPYYGRTWLTTSNALNATTVAGASGSSKAYQYTGAKSLAATYGRRWDDVGKVPWFTYYDSAKASWVEGYYDDATSLTAKWDMVNQKNLAGTGIWTLLMDQGDNALWGLIANKFVNDTTPPTGGIGVLPALAGTVAFTVNWKATDVGSGVKSYSVQARDRATASWMPWLTGTTATSATFVGVPGHSYDFRVSAVDYKGNRQPWLAAMSGPGATLTVGGFARVSVDSLNVRSGAGTGFSTLDQIGSGATVAVLGGPISAGGYQWYQIQFDFNEWPSADYPRTGWVAAGSGSTAYLVPSKPPNMISIAAGATGFYGTAGSAPSTGGRYPAPGATGVSAMVGPAVRFDRIVAGVSGSSFVLRRSNGTTVSAVVYATADPKQYGMRPSAALEAGMTYTLSLSSAITSVEGGALTPTSWNFTVAGTSTSVPSVVGRYPAPGATGVSAMVGPAVRFDRIVAGVSGSSFVLRRSNGTTVSAVVYATADPKQYGMRPSAALEAGMTYTLSLSSAITSVEGGALTPTSWNFTVAGTSTSTSGTATYSPAAKLVFKMGTHTAYKFSSTGAMTAVKSYTLPNDQNANTSVRKTITNQSGTWFYIVNGVWAGYWMRESSSLYLAASPIAALSAPNATFSPAKPLVFKMGTHTAYKFSSSGVMTAQKSYTLPNDQNANTSSRKTITNQYGTWFYIVNGVWAGYWMRWSDVLYLKP